MRSRMLEGAMKVTLHKSELCHSCSFVSKPDACSILKMAYKIELFLGVYECAQFHQREQEPKIEKGTPGLKPEENINNIAQI